MRICELQSTCIKCNNINRYSYYKCYKNSDCMPGELCQSNFCCPIPIKPILSNKLINTNISSIPIIPNIISSSSIDEIKKNDTNLTKNDIISLNENIINNFTSITCPDGSYWKGKLCTDNTDCISNDEFCAEGKCCSSCKQRRHQVLKEHATTDIYGVYIPQCSNDGLTYKSKQCKTATKDCWCVTSFGKQIQNFESKSRYSVLKCENIDIITPIIPQNFKEKQNDRQNIRRSPQRISSYRAFVAECGFNEHYVPCQSSCQPNCIQQTLQECITGTDCIPGCHCLPGYIRLNEKPNSPCVLMEQCLNIGLNTESIIMGQIPQPYQFSPIIGQNCLDSRKEFHICGSSCPITCSNRLQPKCQSSRCIPGCYCKIPYILENDLDSQNSKCILPSECPLFNNRQTSMMGLSPVIDINNPSIEGSSTIRTVKPLNEQCSDSLKNFQNCGTSCPVACNNLNPKCSNQCISGCFCRAPYILKDINNPNSECILVEQCQDLPIIKNGHGVRVLPSSMMRNFMVNNQFSTLNIPHSSLPLILCSQDPKRVWTSCGGSLLCSPSCRNLGGDTCDIKHCTPGCTCRSPYVLLDHTDPQSACVSKEICPSLVTPQQPFSPTDDDSLIGEKNLNSRCSDPLKEYRNCASSCPLGCNNLSPKQCAPCISGCFCKNGYIFEDALNWQISRCITMDNCPSIRAHIRLSENSCSDPFAEYNACGSQCPEYCGQPSKPVCSNICIPSCQCKPGYVRAQNYHSAPCVALTACNSLNSFLANEDKDINITTTTTTTTSTITSTPFITAPSAFADLGIVKILMSSETKDNLHLITYITSKISSYNSKLILAIHKYGDISSSCTRIGEILSIKEQPLLLGSLSEEVGIVEKIIKWNTNIDVLSLVGRAIALHNITIDQPQKNKSEDIITPITTDMTFDSEEINKNIPIVCGVIGLSDQTTF
ncbi:Thyroglobulin type-1 domain and Superoxide dismutase, copper/zinc binding domain and Trypsin Inhibitor-like, cysteine rich domain-containing protein [Strongyloides ratti]|uniref:Thyroglobulin type-1 domain and Superoxide dismutase, copper/zinc binding domain and Trypsin Inhibitor-like, cysteine rich domain-containing protein n=1 Tax=Strongyloides ratti TaxID=34506 RepID=A0A090KU33_STRRB|nr:Thyroglobulin type-1 domain and Superoxide dismutase, copper/zinc binding domain and Trypsin Inhibitor-like, cysteine rich domain-containing protein [Strongyloides ratti]CEF61025.1 Thyroglobulin type-1 domain and Superoxide dismutase, copper/zinc binding domain and Trypsin Inhibitor-like, cysteine rich domain-containing protein [Strongyloides ratti]